MTVAIPTDIIITGFIFFGCIIIALDAIFDII